ncbi:MAG: bifunctional oligoribonuclease/PAP phosphatase NrnA [Bacillota bacterium]|nr:bifunctional oligoribonuclease/PAP phosphatase NrnA [Bacillota bacterium]
MINNEIVSKIISSKNVAILPHIQADGDAIGSCLALGIALTKLNKKVKVIMEESVPEVYNFIPGQAMVSVGSEYKEGLDLVITLDTGDVGRIGERIDVFKSVDSTINIDHHGTNNEFAVLNYVDADSAATGEIIYELIKLLNVDFDADIATCLYVAIATDTGCFKFKNTTSKTHRIISDLISFGVNVSEISGKVFDSTTKEKVRLMGHAINTLELLEEGKIAFVNISNEMLKAAGAKEEDCDGIVNIGRNIVGVEASVVLRERSSGDFKINLRSKTYVDVGQVALKYGGGGHKMAAGCAIKGDLDSIKKMILEELKRLL